MIEGSDQRDMRKPWLTVVGFEDGGKRPGNKKCGHPVEAGKGKEVNYSLENPERSAALQIPWC